MAAEDWIYNIMAIIVLLVCMRVADKSSFSPECSTVILLFCIIIMILKLIIIMPKNCNSISKHVRAISIIL